MRPTIALVVALAASACASAPPAAIKPPEPTFTDKVSAILRLEDRRVLREAAAAVPAAVPAAPVRGRVVVTPEPPPPPDLIRLLSDGEARVRRRAALAIGRVGLAEGVPPLVTLLADSDPEVQQMAAFALGLIGDSSAVGPLSAALDDGAPLVKGAAAEALGLIGDASAAPAIGRMITAQLASRIPLQSLAEDNDEVRDTPAAAFRLGVYALVRLKAYDALAAAVLEPSGQPRVRTWPVAFALQRLEDPRAVTALRALLAEPHPYTRAFAVKGLGAMKDPAAGAALVPLVSSKEKTIAVEAIRSLARLADTRGGAAIAGVVRDLKADPHVRLEAVRALGVVGAPGGNDLLIDLLGDPSPLIRAAAIQSLAKLDPEGFMIVLSGLDPDPQWSVRAALAETLGTLSAEAAAPRLTAMLADPDPKVLPAVLAAVAKLKLPNAGALAIERLTHDDAAVRAAAAHAIEELKPAGADAALAAAYDRGVSDTLYIGRAAALSAITAYGASTATPLLTKGLADPDWAVRVRAATLLKQLDPASDAERRIRPAPALPDDRYNSPRIASPSVSTEAYIDTDRGTIRIELAVVDAPQTVENFVVLARKHFFDGNVIHRVVPDFVVQAGDPRGDGEGGPGYDIRDELNQRPYLRGTVGMALDWKDTGGSQFFITLSPQPHLDARYTAFGRVIEGIEVADQIQQGDVIRRVRIWDGTTMTP